MLLKQNMFLYLMVGLLQIIALNKLSTRFFLFFSGDSLLSPNTFDPSEFPSLGNRDNSAPNPASGLSRPNYGEL